MSSGNLNLYIAESSIQGKGVFTKIKWTRGQIIEFFEGEEIDHDTQYSLVLGGKRIEPKGILHYLNHSCAPNAYFRDRWLVAFRDISPGEEITIDYLATEKMLTYPFTCKCGAENCRGRIE